jgi:hypothetical protein
VFFFFFAGLVDALAVSFAEYLSRGGPLGDFRLLREQVGGRAPEVFVNDEADFPIRVVVVDEASGFFRFGERPGFSFLEQGFSLSLFRVYEVVECQRTRVDRELLSLGLLCLVNRPLL